MTKLFRRFMHHSMSARSISQIGERAQVQASPWLAASVAGFSVPSMSE
jgi:hypothetical protein